MSAGVLSTGPEREHGELWDLMDTPTDQHDGGAETAALVSTCTKLPSVLDRHDSKEERNIHPRADAALDEATTADLRQFIASGRTS